MHMSPIAQLEMFAACQDVLVSAREPGEVLLAVERALRDLVGFRVLTILAADSRRRILRRVHSAGPTAFPVGGEKPITDDWVVRLLQAARPAISPDRDAVRRRFPDHEAIFALGCESVLNVPVVVPGGAVGCVNLMHEAHRYGEAQALVCRPFVQLLAPILHAEQSNDAPQSGA